MKKYLKLLTIIGIITAMVGVAHYAHGASYGFYGGFAEDSDPTNAAIGEDQLYVEVTDVTVDGIKYVLFTFYNDGESAISITDVYFHDGSLLGIADVDDSDSGVSFSEIASPWNLPGGNEIGFQTTGGLSADSDPAVQPNGVNPGETLGIYFTLQDNQTYDDVIAELASGELMIGIHAQGIGGGGSESFVNVVPLPATVLLLSSGLIGLAGLRKKFKYQVYE